MRCYLSTGTQDSWKLALYYDRLISEIKWGNLQLSNQLLSPGNSTNIDETNKQHQQQTHWVPNTSVLHKSTISLPPPVYNIIFSLVHRTEHN